MVSRKKMLMLGVIAPFAILLGGITGCGKAEEAKTGTEPAKVVQARLLTIGERSLPGAYVATGTVKSKLNATLSSKVMGRVVAVNVREGDQIKLGSPLVEIDSRELQSAVNMADANYHASVVGVGSAATAAAMEDKTSKARISLAESQVQQAEAALSAAEARRDLALAGPRPQEVAQSHIAVLQAKSDLELAQIELDRASKLFEAGAIARRDLDLAQNRYNLAKGQHDAALQSESISREGSRSQDIRAAQEAVAQAQAAVKQAKAGVLQAKAAAMQVDVRRKDIEVASAQAKQMAAAAQSARVSLSYGQVTAPFDGRIVARMVDPGSMASPGVPLLAVEGGDYRLEAVVPESLLAGLRKGDTAAIRIDALPGAQLSGRVAEIVPQGDASSHSFLVKFSFSPVPGVKSGMFGKAVLATKASSRISIPQNSTWVREGLNYVFAVNAEGIARLRIITLGEPINGGVEVLSGLSGGDRIVVGDRSGIEDGVKVEAK
ncbi:MAG: efflux RND transporter periplasmic adaptor subunit [Armatimonadetes bacterium]|nr:efflux RND transporter periplasmic adaptor subunit [Armatimonadota bacterium]